MRPPALAQFVLTFASLSVGAGETRETSSLGGPGARVIGLDLPSGHPEQAGSKSVKFPLGKGYVRGFGI